MEEAELLWFAFVNKERATQNTVKTTGSTQNQLRAFSDLLPFTWQPVSLKRIYLWRFFYLVFSPAIPMRHSFLWVMHTIKKLLFGWKFCSHAWNQHFFLWEIGNELNLWVIHYLLFWPEMCFYHWLWKKRKSYNKIPKTQGQSYIWLQTLNLFFNGFFISYVVIILYLSTLILHFTRINNVINFILEWYLSYLKYPSRVYFPHIAWKRGIVYAFIFFHVCMIQHNKALFKYLYSPAIKIIQVYIKREVLGTKTHLSLETHFWNKTEFQMIKEQIRLKAGNQNPMLQQEAEPQKPHPPWRAGRAPAKNVENWKNMWRPSR